ncbi:hypothetical protein FKY70_15420 [Salmonella enterica]|nr:hypothetical protein [Salmonella enterica]
MSCYIRNQIIVNPNQKDWDSEKYSIEAMVNNYPKHEHAGVYVKEGEKEKIIGEVARIYIIDNCIYGDINFTRDWKEVVCRLRKKPYSEVEMRSIGNDPDFSCLDKVIFVDNENYTHHIDLKSIIGGQEHAYWLFNRPFYNNPMEAIQPESAVIFNKKYDNEKTGFAGYVNINEEKPSNYYDIKENNAVITFDNEGENIGNGIMRYGHYCNGALMGYVLCGVTEFGGDCRPRHPLDILDKFVEHQRGSLLRKSSTNT